MHSKEDNSVMYSGAEEVERTLNDDFLTEALLQSRRQELQVLEKRLLALSQRFDASLKIFDIGVGDGYVPLHFGKELIERIDEYVGIDNSAQEVAYCQKNIEKAGLSNKTQVFEFDATHLDDVSFRKPLPLPFHAVVCTYFTPGNFRPDEIELKQDASGKITSYPKEVLKKNKKFQKVFSDAYDLLCEGGELILGSTYIDSDATRLKQEEFYKKCGMHVITSADDSFTATQEGFWSQRFTEEKIYSYLDWVPRKQVEIVPLNGDNFSRMIVIKKP